MVRPRSGLLMLAVALAACGNNVADLKVGTCFDDPGDGEIRNIPFVDCDRPHDLEVYAVVVSQLSGPDFPGEQQLVEEAQVRCIERFAPFVGSDFATSTLDIHYFYASEESWAEDDRSITCAVGPLDGGTLTGTARGSGL